MGNARADLDLVRAAAGHGSSTFARLAAGDQTALDELLQCHWSPLLTYIESLVGDRDVAEDIAQETFLYLWERRARWDTTGSVRALLYRVARSHSLNHVRYQRVRARWASRVEAVQRQFGWTPTPLQVLERAELRSALEDAIAALPPRRREVFQLGYLHACRHAEIADIMGISEQTARNQMSAALTDLRRTLAAILE